MVDPHPVLEEEDSAAATDLKCSVSPADDEERAVLRLRDVSDLTLERELARRRRLAFAETRREGDSDSVVLNTSRGVCGEDGGVCVPCFELA